MYNTKDNFDCFTGVYPINKTLRFELRPVGKTVELIDEFKKGNMDSVVAVDEKRADARKKVIEILDNYYEYFINSVLVNDVLSAYDIKEAFKLYKDFKADRKDKNFKSYMSLMRKEISDKFQTEKVKFALKDYKELFGKKGLQESPLYEWYNQKLDNKEIDQETFEDIVNTLSYFVGFTTSLKDYQNNRDNFFVPDEKSTSIAYRIINENMVRYFDNCIRFETFIEDKIDLYESLKQCEEYFIPANYDKYITQDGIDKYNQVIGRKGKDIYDKGVNQLINEYRQLNKIKNKNLPTMNQMYKQLLSKNNNENLMGGFTSEKDLLMKIESSYYEYSEIVSKLINFIDEAITEDINLHIRSDSITNISKGMFGRWDFINDAIYSYSSEFSEKDKLKFDKDIKEVINTVLLQKIIDTYINNLDTDEIEKYKNNSSINKYLNSFNSLNLKNAFNEAKPILSLKEIDKERADGSERMQQINKLKNLLDAMLEVVHFYRPLYLYKNGNNLAEVEKDEVFYSEFDYLYSQLSPISKLYDKVRNYLTKKSYSKDKFKIYFNKPTLLDGWDLNKESSNLGVLFIKDDNYYLGVMNSKFNTSFDTSIDEVKKQANESQIDGYLKLEYKQVSGASKMFPKVFFAESNKDIYNPSIDILNIRKDKLYTKGANNREAVIKWIDFCKNCIKVHPEWNKYFNFNFRPSEEYEDVNDFYEDADAQMYNLNFINFKESYINELVDEGKLYLFQIYNKDFSSHSKGKPNLHTMYWKMLFEESNIKNINNTRLPVFKLNGEAEIFYRKSSLNKKVTHEKNIPIKNKNKNNAKEESVFAYDLYKDRRYMEDKFFFHCPITINYRTKKITSTEFNKKINCLVENNKDINILGVDRGERHLLYYSLINQKGEILKQGSLNSISTAYEKDGQEVSLITDYNSILQEREAERDDARKNWGTIQNIKDIKDGYMSHIVHQLSKILIENNAVLVLENLNSGFKRGRIKVEKQVYQKFEGAMIEKLNYLVFKDRDKDSAGNYLKGYQLTAPYEGMKNLYRQSGIIYYIWPSYTSKICPKTGFVNLLKLNYENIEKSKEIFNNFDKISYNNDNNYFEFILDYRKFGKDAGNNKWVICTYGNERYFYNSKLKKYECIDITAKMKELFKSNNIDYLNEKDLRNRITDLNSKDFFNSLLFYLRLVLQLRYSNGGNCDENDYILSPVSDINGKFFDSRHAAESEPKNSDANGAYHIALKGLRLIRGIENGTILKTGNETTDWFTFAQNKNNLME